MKSYKLLTLLLAGLMACGEDEKLADPIYEFISFRGNPAVDLNERDHSTEGFPFTLQLLAFKPYTRDIEITFEVTAVNAVESIDFEIVPSTKKIVLKAGTYTSDTLWIKTIDNNAGTELERTVEVAIKTVSETGIRIGLGIDEPRNAAVVARILDDECTSQPDIYGVNDLSNEIDWGSGGTETVVSGSVNGSAITLTGDLIGYDPFANATLTITLTPDGAGAMNGSAMFGEFEAGEDSDGYFYKFIQSGTGTYDLCSGTITISYDIYWQDGPDWVYWYSVTNVISTP
ncbi:MAG TPA: hypothetical protein VEB86_19880 [Chryseosolibacter sp.]|nr:hypothetical protein [Chryseosolibacter sp.]